MERERPQGADGDVHGGWDVAVAAVPIKGIDFDGALHDAAQANRNDPTVPRRSSPISGSQVLTL
jgi:hypothetical protein